MLMRANVRVRARGCSCSAVQREAARLVRLRVARWRRLALHGFHSCWYTNSVALNARSKGLKQAISMQLSPAAC